MIPRLFVYSIALACVAGDRSELIRGVVLDPSGRPVEGARVSCGGSAVFTNVEGRFAVASDNSCDAKIEKTGFELSTQKLSPGAEGHVVLTVEGPTESVIVTATRSQATPEQTAVAANVVDARQLQARDYPAIETVLRELPDMTVVSSGHRGDLTSVFTRGGASTTSLVLLDGVPLNDPGGQINLAHLTSVGIDRIEVVRGPESAQFGAEASSGVIQLFTKRGDPEDTMPHGIISYERGNFQTDRWTAALDGGLFGRLDYALAAEELHSVNEFPNDYYRDNTGSANVGYRISDATQVRGVFRIYDAHLGTPGQTAYQAYDYAANEETRDSTVLARVDDSRGARYFQTFSFGYHKLHDVFNEDEPYRSQSLAALVTGNTYFVNLLNPSALPAQIPPGTRIAMGTAYFGPYGSLNQTERKTADYQGKVAQSRGALVFGYDYQDQSGIVSGTNVNRNHNGFFVNEQYSFGDRLYFSVGGRLEHSSAFGTEFTPRGGVSVKLWPATFVRLSAGRGIIEPSLYENYVQSPYAVGNPALKPEKTNSYEAALVHEWWGHRVKSEAAVFRSSFSDLITYVYPSWQNIQESWARGLEFSTSARVVRNVLISANYTRLYSRVVNSVTPADPVTGIGQPLPRRPRNSGAFVLSATPGRWSLVAGASIIGEQHDSDYTFGVTRNPGYENVYLSASYTLSKHFTPTLRIDNLLNENYQEALGYAALSRSVLGGLRIHW